MEYADAYLAPLVTIEREERALNDVRLTGTFSTEWEERLQIIRVYIIICIESTSSPDDTFNTKLAHYRKEYQQTLALAKAATNIMVFATIPLERN